MTYTTDELLFAAAVNQRINQLRLEKAQNMTDEKFEAWLAQPDYWEGLVKTALGEIELTAKAIRELRADK